MLLTGFSNLKMIAATNIKMMTELLHIVYIETVMYIKLQLLKAISREAVRAGKVGVWSLQLRFSI